MLLLAFDINAVSNSISAEGDAAAVGRDGSSAAADKTVSAVLIAAASVVVDVSPFVNCYYCTGAATLMLMLIVFSKPKQLKVGCL